MPDLPIEPTLPSSLSRIPGASTMPNHSMILTPKRSLELAPAVGRAAGRQHGAHRVVAVVGAGRLLEQDRDHAAERVELDRVVAAAVVEEPRRGEPRGEGQLGVEEDRPDRRSEQRVAVEQRQAGVHRLAGLHAGRLEQLDERGQVVLRRDDALRRAGRARRVHHPHAAGRASSTSTSGSRSSAGQQPLEVPVDAAARRARRPRRAGAASAPRRARRAPPRAGPPGR